MVCFSSLSLSVHLQSNPETDLRYSHLPLDSIGFGNSCVSPNQSKFLFFRLVDLKDSPAFQSPDPPEASRGLPGGFLEGNFTNH